MYFSYDIGKFIFIRHVKRNTCIKYGCREKLLEYIQNLQILVFIENIEVNYRWDISVFLLYI